jgi:hypothetical protein
MTLPRPLVFGRRRESQIGPSGRNCVGRRCPCGRSPVKAYGRTTRLALKVDSWHLVEEAYHQEGGSLRGTWREYPPAREGGYVSSLCLQYVSREGALPDSQIDIGDWHKHYLLHRKVRLRFTRSNGSQVRIPESFSDMWAPNQALW